jgi:ABC-type transport system substrate-binding protein
LLKRRKGEKKMKLSILISIVMIAIAASLVIPTYAFVVPPNPTSANSNSQWELFGPHVQGILITIYDSTTSEWNDMNLGKIDITDWALDATHLSLWGTPNNAISEANYGGDNGYFLIDINNNDTYCPSDSGPYYMNPTGAWLGNPTWAADSLALREAIAYCVNHSYITQFSAGLDLPIYTPMPLYMAYVEPTIYPGAGNSSLTWTNPSIPGDADLAAAVTILNAAGFTIDPVTGWRIDPRTGKDLTPLIFYARTGDRNTIGVDVNTNLNLIGIPTTFTGNEPRSAVTGPVFAQQYFNLYTGGWTGIGPDPDYVCDLYNSSNYYHPGSPENYNNVHYPQTDQWASATKLALDIPSGTQDVYNFQYYYAYYVAGVPMYSTTGVKAFKNVPSETSTSMAAVTPPPDGDWCDVVNQKSVGANSWWSTLDMETYGNLYPALNISYGFSSSITLQNIVYAQWFWDDEVLGRIYDGGWARDPYTLVYSPTTGVPQLFKNFTVGTWVDPITHATKTSVIVTLRPDVYWQDGQPVTIADVYYSLIQISNQLLAKGFPPPWWYTTVEYMQSVEILDDYNIEVLLSVQSAWAAGWVAGALVLPMHIWQPIVAASISPSNNPVVQGTTPDPNIIGTGPYRWVSGIGTGVGTDVTVYLEANTPGSVVHGITSPGYYLWCPIYVDLDTPNHVAKINILPSQTSTTVNIIVTFRNEWLGGTLDGSWWLLTSSTLAGVNSNAATVVASGSDLPLTPVSPYPLGISYQTVVPITLGKKTLTYVKLAFHIETPPTLTLEEDWNGTTYTYNVPNPWISQWQNTTMPIWVTIKEDIAGSNIYTVMYPTVAATSAMTANAPSPDLKVDVKDIAAAAKAFGSVPGSPTWNAAADPLGLYKIDIKDIADIAKQFGY